MKAINCCKQAGVKVKQAGFTLIELMITIAIVGILAAIAIPSYLNYTEKAQFSEVVQAASSLKHAVATCAHTVGTLTGCTNGANGVPAAQGAAGNVAGMVVANGQITATAQNLSQAYTYILVPTLVNGVVTWDDSTGTCAAAGVC